MAYPLRARLRIEPPARWRSIDLAELWRYRELLYFLVWRDIKVRYKQTVLGALWAVIQPVAATILFAIVLGRFAGLSKQVDQPYPLFVYAGLVLWTFFSTAVTNAANSLVGSTHLISKVYFPRLLIPLSAIVSGLIDFLIAFAVLLVLMAWYGVAPSWQIVTVPIFVIGTVLAAAGAGVLLAALIVTYRDFRYVIMFLIQLWLFATPVLYPLTIVPEKYRLLYALNPMVGMISGARAALFGTAFPGGVIVISWASALVVLAAGVQYFASAERRFADVI